MLAYVVILLHVPCYVTPQSIQNTWPVVGGLLSPLCCYWSKTQPVFSSVP
jgi:hypothetical protein